MRVEKASHSASFWIVIALVALVAVQIPPIPGIYLMMLGAGILAGFLAHALLASLFLESAIARIPRAFIAIPLLAYSTYYADYFYEEWAIQKAVSAVPSAEPSVALRFNPAEHSLVVKNARAFVSDYDVPVAYEAAAKMGPEGYQSYRLLPVEQCAAARTRREMLGTTRVLPRAGGKLEDGSPCVFATPERPLGTIVTVSERGADEVRKLTPRIVERAIDVSVGGKPIATYVAGAYAWHLSSLPLLFIGCALIDNPPAWTCDAQFNRTLTAIGRADDMQKQEFVFALAAKMLGIAKIPLVDSRAAPRPIADLDILLAKLPKKPLGTGMTMPAEDRELFALFVDFLANDAYMTMKSGASATLLVDGADEPSIELTVAVMRDPARLGPLRDQMIAKLSAIHAHGIPQVSPWVGLIARALAAIPKSDFVAIPDDSLSLLQRVLQDSQGYPDVGLYVRAGDVGERALPFYSADAVRWARIWPDGENPALAICRIGKADDAARQALRAAYLKSFQGELTKKGFNFEQYGTALFLALLASGDEQFLRDNSANGADALEDEWLRLLLDGKGWVDGRPNNCRAIDLAPAQPNDPMAPGLMLNGGQWHETAAAGGR